MSKNNLMLRIGAVLLGLSVAVAVLASASAQPGSPPHHFYGTGATAGDEITAHDADGNELGSATVDADGGWSISAAADPDGVSFYLNGVHAEAEVTPTGQTQSAVVLTVVVMEEPEEETTDDAMGEDGDDSMMGEDGDDSMMGDDDAMEDDSMMGEDDSLDTEEDSMMDDDELTMPDTGSGGLADTSGVSAGLIGLLIALGVAAAAGFGLRRVRNRA